MPQSKVPLQVSPGKGLGFIVLGGSLHDILTRLKAQPLAYPKIDVSYSNQQPLIAPVILTLPNNGLRLRFDGPDQRLRLIEVLDFTKIPLTYKNVDLIKPQDDADSATSGCSPSRPSGPAFRQVYHKLFGPTFAGEYFEPADGLRSKTGTKTGTYILSYPGVAFSFLLQHSAWSPNIDFVSILSSSATSVAQCLTIFNGSSWKEASQDLFTRPCPHPRSLALTGRGREGCPDEIDLVKVCGRGRIDLLRRSSAPFRMILGETTPQDLIAELGPPDAIYRKHDRRLSIHKTRTASRSGQRPSHLGSPGQFDGQSDTDRSSTHTPTDDSDYEDEFVAEAGNRLNNECFYNYFHHGFDVFVSHPSSISPGLIPSASDDESLSFFPNANQLVVTKLLLHANVPGSYPFNRYRRTRWVLDPDQIRSNTGESLNSETPFSIISAALQRVWVDPSISPEERVSTQRPMILNRGWGDSPGSSCELLGGWEESAEGLTKGGESASSLGNTELFGFPGLLLEVLKNEAVSCLTVY